jgi:ferrous iron transport protein B
MNLMKDVFGALADWLRAVMPEGILRDFLAGGVVNGLSGTLVFLPQICLLFFMISLLEDTGYLARGAFVVNRFLSPFGLSGHAFVPLLSSHACALPGILATRAIPDRRERLAAILVAPFMSCSARIPVYVLLTTLLFPERPARQALAFCGCYALGMLAGLLSAFVARRTILRGPARPMALELPSYKAPSVLTALLTTWDRAWVFLRTAGTNILAICVLLWWLSTYPQSEPPARATQMRAMVQGLADEDVAPTTPDLGEALRTAGDVRREAARTEHAAAMADSFAGRIGRAIQPVFEPLGYDWKLTVGVLTSFAAREVFVSTMAIITTGEAGDDPSILGSIARATRDDGVTPVFTTATSWSLLVYYVLAMQCLPTLAVTTKEAGGIKWAALQLGWMSGLAYLSAWAVRAALAAAGVA